MITPIQVSFALILLMSATSAAAQTLDYAQFKSSVEPIFLLHPLAPEAGGSAAPAC